MSTPAELLAGAAPTRREAGVWAGAATFVVAAHLAVAYAFAALTPARQPEAMEQALTVELTPFLITQPEAIQSDTLTEETPEEIIEEAAEEPLPVETEDEPLPMETAEAIPEAEPEEIVEDEPEPVETEQAKPEEIVEDVSEPIEAEPAEPEIVEAEPDIVEPETIEPAPVDQVEPIDEVVEEVIVEAPKPEVVLPKPKPKVVKEAPKAKPKPVEKKVARAEPKAKPAAKREQAKAKPAPKSTALAKTSASKAQTVSPARWHSQVYAAIARRKPRGRGVSGNVSVSFVVSSSGSVVSAGIARSSGNSSLDKAALAMVRGARVPAPPPGLPGSRHPFTIPVSFE